MVLSDLQRRPSAREEGREAAEEGLKGLVGWAAGSKFLFRPCISIFLHFRNSSLVRVLFLFFFIYYCIQFYPLFLLAVGWWRRVAGVSTSRTGGMGILYSEYYFSYERGFVVGNEAQSELAGLFIYLFIASFVRDEIVLVAVAGGGGW